VHRTEAHSATRQDTSDTPRTGVADQRTLDGLESTRDTPTSGLNPLLARGCGFESHPGHYSELALCDPNVAVGFCLRGIPADPAQADKVHPWESGFKDTVTA
jgi:hypothetical protein